MRNSHFTPNVIYRNRPSAEVVVAVPSPAVRAAQPGPQGFPARLTWVREQAGLSQLEVDRYSAMTPGHTSNICAGRKSEAIEARILARLARTFGCTMDWLYLGIGNAPSAREIETAVDIADGKMREVTEAVLTARDKMRAL